MMLLMMIIMAMAMAMVMVNSDGGIDGNATVVRVSISIPMRHDILLLSLLLMAIDDFDGDDDSGDHDASKGSSPRRLRLDYKGSTICQSPRARGLARPKLPALRRKKLCV